MNTLLVINVLKKKYCINFTTNIDTNVVTREREVNSNLKVENNEF